MVWLAIAGPAAGAVHRIVSSDAGGVTVEFVIPPVAITPAGTGSLLSAVSVEQFFTLDIEGQPVLPMRRFFIEVPGSEGVALDVLAEDSYPVDGVFPRVALRQGSRADQWKTLAAAPRLSDQRFVRFQGVGMVRGRHLALVDVYPVLYDPERRGIVCARRLVVRVSFASVGGGKEAGVGKGLVDEIVINGAQAGGWEGVRERVVVGERTPFEFALSDRWIKIRVRDKGVYRITYADLLAAGTEPSGIDPATVRLFSAGPYPEPDSLHRGGSWREDYHLREHAILVRGGGSGSFQPGDTVLFWGLGVNGWVSEAEAGAGVREYREHPYDSMNVYWLTWGGGFAGEPRRMGVRSVVPGAADTVITWYEERVHVESDLLYDPIYTDDRWYWQLLRRNDTSSFTDEFYLYDVADGAGVLKTKAGGPGNSHCSATYQMNGAIVGTLEWTVLGGYWPAGMKTLEAVLSNLVEGRNVFRVVKPVDNEMYVFWYEVFYRRLLRARQGYVGFQVPAGRLTASCAVGGFAAGERFLFDVTEDESPVACVGWDGSGGGIAFRDSLGESGRHYAAVSRAALRRFERGALERVTVRSLRDESGCPAMVIVYHGAFRAAAEMLKAHHERGIPGVADPVVKAVEIGELYDNFSGGRKDPMAIRNYLKYLYDRQECMSGLEPALAYVLLLGNGTYDPRDLLAQHNDFIPFRITVKYPNESEGIEDEDFLVKLDGGVDRAPDLAIGRMSVLTAGEANAWAERIVDYEENPEYGIWRNKILLVADDEYHPPNGRYEHAFQNMTELLATSAGPFPAMIDFEKIYLHRYPFDGASKPAARNDLIERWSEGAILVHFNGHGSHLQMADERVLVNTDIYSLTNGMRRPLVIAFSCDVGDLESPFHRSVAQNLVTFDDGGAIATIAAVSITFLEYNTFLNELLHRYLFTSKDSTGTRPVGRALQLTKCSSGAQYYEFNNIRYALLGDPAMRLAMPSYLVEHQTAPIDTMRTGRRYRVEGAVMAAGRVLSSYNGIAEVSVREAEERVCDPDTNFDLYEMPGGELFRGTVDVAAGRFAAEFVLPLRCRLGAGARIRSYVTSSSLDGVGACDTLHIVSTASIPHNDGPPSVALYFAGQATKVKSGAKLMAEISDPDGIAILGTDPQSSIFFEFDGSGYPIYVTEYFAYEHGSYTTGKVEYPLHAGFSPGEHTVLIKVFDNLGLASSATLRFEIVDEGLYAVSDVFGFPNPFSRSTNFVFQVTSPADAVLSVYSVGGVKVWERRVGAGEGFNSVPWDGRDVAGDELANGTYLYVLEVSFREGFRRTETIRGKVVLAR